MEKRILFIDDDSSDLEALRRMLHNQRQNWGIYFARSVDAALEKIQGCIRRSRFACQTEYQTMAKNALSNFTIQRNPLFTTWLL